MQEANRREYQRRKQAEYRATKAEQEQFRDKVKQFERNDSGTGEIGQADLKDNCENGRPLPPNF
jgi:hypothetical protein